MGIWLGLEVFLEDCFTWDESLTRLVKTGAQNKHLYHLILNPEDALVYVYEDPFRAPGMKLVDAVSVRRSDPEQPK